MICSGPHCILGIIALIVLGPLLGTFIGISIKPTKRVLSYSLGLAAGVMLAISFLQLIPHSIGLGTIWIALVGFVDGFLLIMVIDLMLPHMHVVTGIVDSSSKKTHKCFDLKLYRCGMLIVVGIALHNLPEGFAIASGLTHTLKLGIIIALGIALHDIPEAIASTIPLYASTRNKARSFLISMSTTIPTLIGFASGYFLLRNISEPVLGLSMAITAGIMVYITLDELVPRAEEQGHMHAVSIGIMTGIILVMLSNLL